MVRVDAALPGADSIGGWRRARRSSRSAAARSRSATPTRSTSRAPGYTKLDLVTLLPGGRRRRADRRPRPADGAQALRRRRPTRSRSSRSGRPTTGPTGSATATLTFPSGRTADEIVARRGGRARVGRQPRLHRPQPAPGPRRRPRPPRRAARRPRPGARRALVAGPRGGARRARGRWRPSGSSAGPRRRARGASTSTSGSSRAGRTARSGARRWRWPATSSGAPRRSRPRSGGRRSATACSSTTTRTPRTGRSPRRTRSGRRPTRGSRSRCAGTRCPTSWPEDFTLATVPAIYAERGDAGAGIDEAVGSLEALLELSARDEAEGQGDAPWPPNYAKQEGEPPRVQPSKKRRKPTTTYEGRGKDGGPPPEVAAERAAAVAAGDRNAGLPTEWEGSAPVADGPPQVEHPGHRDRAGARRRPRSTRASSAGRRATPRRSRTSSPRTSSRRRCAAGPTPGTGCGST